MKNAFGIFSLIGLVCLVAFWAGCVLEDKVVEVIYTDQTSAEFQENHQSETFTTPKVVDYADSLDSILADNGISKSDIVSAFVVSASYGVISFTQAHDWIISGAITVERQDIAAGPDTLIKYTSQSVAGALGKKIKAKLEEPGVNLINEALAQYIDDTHDPILVFKVENGSARSDPGDTPPTPADPIIFEWKAWLVLQVILSDTFETPDPF